MTFISDHTLTLDFSVWLTHIFLNICETATTDLEWRRQKISPYRAAAESGLNQ